MTPVRAPRPTIQVPQVGSESTLSPVREEDDEGTSLLGALDGLREDMHADEEGHGDEENIDESKAKDDDSREKTPGPAFAPAPGIYLSPLRGDASSGSQHSTEGNKVEASISFLACPASSLTSTSAESREAGLPARSPKERAWHW